jgi:hypothetical protein
VASPSSNWSHDRDKTITMPSFKTVHFQHQAASWLCAPAAFSVDWRHARSPTNNFRSRARVFPRLCPSPDPATNEHELARGRTLLIGAVRGNPCVSSAAEHSIVLHRHRTRLTPSLHDVASIGVGYRALPSCTCLWKRSQSNSIEPSASTQVRARAFGTDLSLDRRGPE